jgi:hypothetical protein
MRGFQNELRTKGVASGLAVALGEGLTEALADALADALGDTLGGDPGEGVADTLGVTEADGLAVGLGEGLPEMEGEEVPEMLLDGEADAGTREALGVEDSGTLEDAVGDMEGLEEGDGSIPLGHGLSDAEGEALAEAEGLEEGLVDAAAWLACSADKAIRDRSTPLTRTVYPPVVFPWSGLADISTGLT